MPDAGDDAYEDWHREQRAKRAADARKKADKVMARTRKKMNGPRRTKRKRKRTRVKSDVGKVMLARLHQERAQLGETRNNLRAIECDAGELAENAEEALESLDNAITTLSKYV